VKKNDAAGISPATLGLLVLLVRSYPSLHLRAPANFKAYAATYAARFITLRIRLTSLASISIRFSMTLTPLFFIFYPSSPSLVERGQGG